MPYNTRRKSLSLSSLGIHVPVSNAVRAANRAALALSTSSTSSTRTSSPASMASPSHDQPPTRRLKRPHTADADDSEPAPKRREEGVRFDNTPPPSPRTKRRSVKAEDSDDDAEPKPIDMGSINDEIVEAVIVQLQNTGNRPHIVKELAAVLMQQLKIVQQSANACAIISSRLASYLKRSCWSAKSPCPLAKELETVHPRRTYFYLTTCPRQPLPDPAQAAALSQLAHLRTIVTPSLSSSASSSEEDADMERRRELSPSPEVDLSSPEFDDGMDDDMPMPSTPIGSLSLRGLGGMHHRHYSGAGASGRSNNRATSPPLEKDEKEFTQTADGLQKRKLKGDEASSACTMEVDYSAKDDSGLFGEKMTGIFGSHHLVTSPSVRPSTTMSLNFGKRDLEAEGWAKLENMMGWDRSPENIELEELDGLLNGY